MHTARDETAARLASIVESSDDAIVSKDLNGYISSWNAAAERMFGYTQNEIVGKHITTIIPVERQAEEDHVLNEIRQGRRVDHFETVRCRKDGSLIDVSLTISPIYASDGHIIGASKIARDITEQKRLREAAADASRAKDEFLATLSHELRTPLNTVLGYTHMLQSGTLQPAVLEKALEAISRNAEALTRLVNDVLDASRIVTGKMHLNLERCDLAAVVRGAVETIEPAISAKGQHLRLELADGMIVTGDADRLRQVMWNLLSNAAKFTPVGGAITVRGEVRQDSVLLEVADTGSGISADALPRIFERFWQVDSTHTRGFGGLGLGLSLVRHFVELHGGIVAAHSEGLGKGARFVIELPRAGRPDKKKGEV
jgi:PAS domain S-box-containing protein